jgi:hypothetical protein
MTTPSFRRNRPNAAAITEPPAELAAIAAIDALEVDLVAKLRDVRGSEQALVAERKELAGPAILADDLTAKKRLLAIRGEVASIGAECAEIEDALAELGSQREALRKALAATLHGRAIAEAKELAARYVGAADKIDELLALIAVEVETLADSAQGLARLREPLGNRAPVTTRLVGEGLLQGAAWNAGEGVGVLFGCRRDGAIGAARSISATARRVLGGLLPAPADETEAA